MGAVSQPASGRQFEIRLGTQRAVVVEVGGGLREYEAGGRTLLDSYGLGERAGAAQGQPLIPWPNRLRDGRFSFRGVEHQVPLSEPSRGNAIHGLVRWASWQGEPEGEAAVWMRHVLRPQDGWPFTLALAIRYSLEAEGLMVRTELANEGDAAFPVGVGFHPYLRAGAPPLDGWHLTVPARRRLELGDRGLPTGEEPAVAGTAFDFREGRELGSAVLDTAFSDLVRDPDGRARVRLAAPGEAPVTLWMDEAFSHVMIFTGDSLPEAARRRRSLGVEPMTCPPNALQSGLARALEPAERWTVAWGLDPFDERAKLT